jgi:hypothetical protein
MSFMLSIQESFHIPHRSRPPSLINLGLNCPAGANTQDLQRSGKINEHFQHLQVIGGWMYADVTVSRHGPLFGAVGVAVAAACCI